MLGPSRDGGYYLIGGRTPLPDLFSGDAMEHRPGARGDPRAARARGVAWRELPTLRDVDTAEDARAEGLLT